MTFLLSVVLPRETRYLPTRLYLDTIVVSGTYHQHETKWSVQNELESLAGLDSIVAEVVDEVVGAQLKNRLPVSVLDADEVEICSNSSSVLQDEIELGRVAK